MPLPKRAPPYTDCAQRQKRMITTTAEQNECEETPCGELDRWKRDGGRLQAPARAGMARVRGAVRAAGCATGEAVCLVSALDASFASPGDLFAMFAAPSPAVALAQVKIGLVLSLTGPAASLGIPARDTVELLPKQIGGQSRSTTSCSTTPPTPPRPCRTTKKLISENHARRRSSVLRSRRTRSR